MRSLRANLLLGASLGIAVVLLVLGLLVNVLVRQSLVEQFDAALLDEGRLLAATIEFEGGAVVLDNADLELITLIDTARPPLLQIWLGPDRVIHRSKTLGGADLQRPCGPHISEGFLWIVMPGGGRGRAVGLTFRPREELEDEDDVRDDGEEEHREVFGEIPLVTLVLARHTAPIDDILSRLLLRLTLLGLLTLAVSVVVLSLVIHRALRPLNQLATRIGGLDERTLSDRLEGGQAPPEVRPIIDQLNNLLVRLTRAFQRERAFSADIAHELRTPLSGLRSTIDVVLARNRPAGEYEEALGECLDITLRMQDMVSRLLYQGRLESGQVDPQPEPLALNDLLRSSWAALEERAAERGLNVQWEPGENDRLVSDRSLLTLVIQNILENAVEHADEGGEINISTACGSDGACIEVSNSGSELTAAEVPLAFDRFWRGDTARSGNGGHCGLGLSLVKRAVDVMGGEVTVRSETGGRFGIRITFPR
jgi:signal transduction histidine kinase